MIYFKVPQVFPLFKRWQQPKTTNNASSSLVLTWKQQVYLFCDRLRCFFLEPDTYVRPGNRFVLHVLYWLSSWDVINSVRLNKYVDYPNLPQQLYNAGPESSNSNKRFQISNKNIDGKKVLNDVYTTLFYFAQLKPRLLYSVGALLRALQLCTPACYIFDPIIGVGFGLNLCTIFCGTSRWLKPLILGWTTTKSIWLWLGAYPIHGGYVPITLTLAGQRPQPPPPTPTPAPTTYSLGY